MDLNNLAKNPEQIQQLITLLQSLLPTEPAVESPNPVKPSINPSRDNSGSTSKHHNKFLSMPEMNMHKEDHEVDQKLAKHAPTIRAREYDPVTVMCRMCGKKETISPSLVDSSNRYKCNKCSSTAG
jgi:hypothetical protein